MRINKEFIHYLPLIAFTFLAVIATGLLIAGTVHMALSDSSKNNQEALYLPAILLIAGAIISFLHLGRKIRAPRATLGLLHSWLSREIVLLSLTIGLLLAFITLHSLLTPAFWHIYVLITASVVALCLSFSLGIVYSLPGQYSWRNLHNILSPPATSLLIASYLLVFGFNLFEFNLVFYAFLFTDLLLVYLRSRSFISVSENEHFLHFRHLKLLTMTLLLIRFAISLAIFALIMTGWTEFILILLLGNSLLDRFTFYSGEVQYKPGAQIKQVKAERMARAINEK